MMHFYGMEYKVEERPEARCLECGDRLEYGRSDRKFCSDRCRNRYHNRRNYAAAAARIKALNALEKNHDILSAMISGGISSILLSDLVEMGFSPSSCSSCSRYGCHLEYRCFDISYLMSSNRVFRLKKAGPSRVGCKKCVPE